MNKYHNHVNYLQVSKEPMQLWIYKSTTEDDALSPTDFLFIFNFPLSKEESEEQDLSLYKVMFGFACDILGSHSPEAIGCGETRELALAKGVYQRIRLLAHQNQNFIPTIKFEEAVLINTGYANEGECVPTAFSASLSLDEMGKEPIIDNVYTVEYANSQWEWADSFTEAVEILVIAESSKEISAHVKH